MVCVTFRVQTTYTADPLRILPLSKHVKLARDRRHDRSPSLATRPSQKCVVRCQDTTRMCGAPPCTARETSRDDFDAAISSKAEP